MGMLPRRSVLFGGIAVAVGAAACVPSPAGGPPDVGVTGEGRSRLTARPQAAGPVSTAPRPGMRGLDLGPGREVRVHVPAGARHAAPARLVLGLHGAGSDARAGLGPLVPLADAHRLLVLAPASQGRTWDVILGGWGPAVRRIDDALEDVFSSYPVDP